jgi:ParB family chromosome partitioning protein
LIPLIVRINPHGDGYEIIAGHRRKEAALWAGLTEVPVIVRRLDDDQSVIAMVDSNLQREKILPSEKAFAYKMRLSLNSPSAWASVPSAA